MKVCPVCSESFGDEFSFCDIDGTRLRRDGAAGPSHSKVWSMLGVGLIIGAVGVTAASIIFLRKPPAVPVATRGAESQTNSNVAKTPPAETPESAIASDTSEMNANIAPLAIRKDKSANSNANTSTGSEPGDKSAAEPQPSTEATSPQPEPAVSTPPPARPEAPPVVETRVPETNTKAAESASEKKEIKQAANKNDKDSDKKKDEGKDKKKGGGFLKVFKKIFGKD